MLATAEAIEAVAHQLKIATNYAMIFGKLPAGDAAERMAALRKQFAYLAKMVHPDHAATGAKTRAGEVFKHLNELRSRAEDALVAGTYDTTYEAGPRSHAAHDAGVELRSPAGTYRLADNPFRTGDFSMLYRGVRLGGTVREDVIVKIASVPVNNVWLEREAQVLRRFHDAKCGDRLAKVSAFVPKLRDAFLVTGAGGMRYRANVVPYSPDYVSVAEIIAAFPNGLDPQDAAWIARRIFAQTIAASMAHVVHGALVPDHILVHPFTHDPLHIGWAHSVQDPKRTGARITHVIERWKDVYPPEVFQKKTPDHRTDLFMAGKTIIVLLGGDAKRNTLPTSVPEAMARTVLRCVEADPNRRIRDGKQALDEFTRVVRSLWGKAYRPLVMPVR